MGAAGHQRPHRTPQVLGYMDRLSGTFIEGGFTPDLTHHVMHALGRDLGVQPGPSTTRLAATAGRSAASPGHGAEAVQQTYPVIAMIALDAAGEDLSRSATAVTSSSSSSSPSTSCSTRSRRLQEAGWRFSAVRLVVIAIGRRLLGFVDLTGVPPSHQLVGLIIVQPQPLAVDAQECDRCCQRQSFVAVHIPWFFARECSNAAALVVQVGYASRPEAAAVRGLAKRLPPSDPRLAPARSVLCRRESR